MVALLLQPSSGNAVLSAWRHDGAEWKVLPEIHVPNLSLAGAMQLVTTQQKATLLVNDQQITTMNAEELGIECCNRGLGIRWIGASVRPHAVEK
jgi:hypothetical protein